MTVFRNFIIAAIIFFFPVLGFSAETSPLQFLRMQSSARSAAMAGCFVTMKGDPNAVFFNPATIYTVEEKPFSATFLKHVLDINSGLVSYVTDMPEVMNGKFAGSVSYVNYGSFDAIDEYGDVNGTFGVNNIAAAVSYADELDTNLFWGASFKMIFIQFENQNSFSLAVDAGLLYQLPDGRSNIGISILHAGSQIMTLSGENEPLPLDIRMGINHRLKGGLPLLVNFSLNHLADYEENFFDKFRNFSIAGELYLGKVIRLRLGYDNQIRQLTSFESDKKFSGFSIGTGFIAGDFNFDYGLAIVGSNAMMHRFTVDLTL